MLWTKASGKCFYTFLFWPVLNKWCTSPVTKIVGYLHAGSSCHSAVPCQDKKVTYWIELHRIPPAPGTLPCFHYWSKWGSGKCASVTDELQFGIFQRRFVFSEVLWESTVGHHGSRKRCQRGKTFVSRKKTCQRQMYLLRLLQGMKATTHFPHWCLTKQR